MNLSFTEYCEQYNLDIATLPKCTNRARASLDKAHGAVRRTNAMRIGQLCARIEGDSKVDVFQITAAADNGDETTYTLVPCVEDGETLTMTHSQVIEQLRPITKWSSTAKKGGAAV
jgi:hypothetical protein